MSKNLLLALSLAFVAHPLFAANINWNVSSGEWKDSGNWNPNSVPSDSDAAWISNNGTVTITENATASYTNVGGSGTTNSTLRLNSGVTLTTTGSNSNVGSSAGYTGIAHIAGLWDATGRTVYVGAGGTGFLTLVSGGNITASSLLLGNVAGANGTATIGGSVTTTGAVTIGGSGDGNMTLSSGGSITSVAGTVGNSGNGTAKISGLWSFGTGAFTVGQNNGSLGSVTLESGGELRGSTGSAVTLGSSAGSHGEMTIKNGGNLSASSKDFYVGNGGEGELIVNSGGVLTTAVAHLGYSGADSMGTVTLNGTWTNSGTLDIAARSNGVAGSGNLTIESAGVLKSGVAYLGGSSDGAGEAIVTIKSGGSWESTDQILIGRSGNAIITVESWATLASAHASRLGVYAAGHGKAFVAGNWTIGGVSPGSSDSLRVGESGIGELTMQNGGKGSSYTVYIGSNDGSIGNMTIQNGASWSATQNVLVGEKGRGNLLIEQGGNLTTAALGSVGYSQTANGSATIRGTWTISGNDLEVGRAGVGIASIGAGGLVNVNSGSGTVYLARSDNSAIGVLNIGAAVPGGIPNAAEGAGTLNAAVVTGRTSAITTPLLNFNHTESAYEFKNTAGDGIAIQNNVAVHVYAGTTSLIAASTYTAGTQIHGGTLLVNNASGSATGTGAVQVAAGATLGGCGTISGATTVDGILSPGNSIGTLTISNDVTWNSNDAWVWELGTAGVDKSNTGVSDLLVISGGGSDFLKGTGSVFQFDFSGTGQEGWYKLITWGGTTGFSDGDFQATNLASGLSGSFEVDSGALYLNVVPEPSVVGLLVLAAAGLGAIRRRRTA